jgi:predicted N-acetyltransferase YhbS
MRLRNYQPDRDFLRIRDFLTSSYRAFGKPLNWRIERWNYARYFIAPLLGGYGQKEPRLEDSLRAIRFWEDKVGVWENDEHEIAGVVNMEYPHPEHPGFGEAFLQRHPHHVYLLDDMLDYAEATLINKKKNTLHIYIYDHDEALRAVVRRRGYQKDAESFDWDSEFVIEDLPEPRLSEGYLIRSMARENNIELRREVFGRAFNHPDPADWPSAFTYQELQRAPDYRKDLDLYVLSPEGRYVAFCIVWYDEVNRLGSLEPVAAHPDHRRLGLGREVVLEGIRRAAALGANKVCVGSGQRFYEAIGFQKKYISYRWTRKF